MTSDALLQPDDYRAALGRLTLDACVELTEKGQARFARRLGISADALIALTRFAQLYHSVRSPDMDKEFATLREELDDLILFYLSAWPEGYQRAQ